MPVALTNELPKYGIAGLVVFDLLLALGVLWKKLLDKDLKIEELQKLRVEDAQGVTAQLLRTNTECVTALTNVASATEAGIDTSKEIKNSLEKLGEKVDRLRPGS